MEADVRETVESHVNRVVAQLQRLAQEGERQFEDPACLALFGVARDCAFQLQQQLALWQRCPEMSKLANRQMVFDNE